MQATFLEGVRALRDGAATVVEGGRSLRQGAYGFGQVQELQQARGNAILGALGGGGAGSSARAVPRSAASFAPLGDRLWA